MAGLFGTFEKISVDDKGRFSIPSLLRDALSDASEKTLMVVRGTEGCLFAYPKDEWLRFWQDLRDLPVTPENTRLRRRIMSSLKETRLDNQGRATLSQPLKEMAGIENDLVLMGDGERLEIWNSRTWTARAKVDEETGSYETDYYRAQSEIRRNRNGG